ncbi:phospho-acceptor domain-containing protein [Dinghuibacter silviterrae]|uniref:histidine kinase n=2 Tax=Dinghuibacter silviterrae TaxID=1539049 RepID=A0A4R8DGH4_9BACT|nr:phospho-acceptor domain-containing protein [Dinghuibacter silviterrae]
MDATPKSDVNLSEIHDLRHANALLRQRNAELEQFAYVTSHDLQEPLRKIRVFVDMLLLQELEKDRYHALDRIRSSADRMAQLIRDLLSYSRVGQEGHPFVPTDLHSVVLAALRDFDLRIEETGATVHILPLPTIDAVPLQMNQLFCNLLGNALKFRRPDTTPLLHVSAQLLGPEEVTGYPGLAQGESYYRIVVKDNGIGFNPAFTEKIFAIFQRLHQDEHFPGTGIGLAICRKIAHQHRGEIFAYGREGEGAEFHVVLPQRYRLTP